MCQFPSCAQRTPQLLPGAREQQHSGLQSRKLGTGFRPFSTPPSSVGAELLTLLIIHIYVNVIS